MYGRQGNMEGSQRWEINIPEIQRKGNVVPNKDWSKCTALQLLYIK